MVSVSVLLAMFSSCSEEDIPESPATGDYATQTEASRTSVREYRGTVYMSPAAGTFGSDSRIAIFPNIASADQADLLVLGNTELASRAAEIRAALKRGATIAVINPTAQDIRNAALRLGVSAPSGEQATGLSVWAFSNRGCYTMQQGFGDGSLQPLADWLISLDSRKSATRGSDISDYLKFNIYADVHDGFNKHKTDVTLSYVVEPLYLSEGSKAGDYYVIYGTVKYHNRIPADNGYYMTQATASYKLRTPDGKAPGNLSFVTGGSPQPSSFEGGIVYSAGISFHISGGLILGKNNLMGGTIGLTLLDFNYNFIEKSKSYSLPDACGSLNSAYGNVEYTYTVQPNSSVAQNDFDIENAWIWYVPKDSNEDLVGLGSDKALTLKFALGATYCDKKGKNPISHLLNYSVALCTPQRITAGCVTLQNTTDFMLAHVKFWKYDENGNVSKDPVIADDKSYEYGETKSYTLPTGKYRMTYDFYREYDSSIDSPDSPDFIRVTTMKQDDIIVVQGATQEASTTSIDVMEGTMSE